MTGRFAAWQGIKKHVTELLEMDRRSSAPCHRLLRPSLAPEVFALETKSVYGALEDLIHARMALRKCDRLPADRTMQRLQQSVPWR